MERKRIRYLLPPETMEGRRLCTRIAIRQRSMECVKAWPWDTREFLGTISEVPYKLQTNVCGNGKGDGPNLIGREQQFCLWFDLTKTLSPSNTDSEIENPRRNFFSDSTPSNPDSEIENPRRNFFSDSTPSNPDSAIENPWRNSAETPKCLDQFELANEGNGYQVKRIPKNLKI